MPDNVKEMIARGHAIKKDCDALAAVRQGYHCRPDKRDGCLAHDLAVELEMYMQNDYATLIDMKKENEALRKRVAELQEDIAKCVIDHA